jgi:hypothetical protein
MLGFAGDDASTLVRGVIYSLKHGGKRPLRKLLDALNRLVSGASASRPKSGNDKSRSDKSRSDKSRSGDGGGRRRKSSRLKQS